MPQMIPKGTNTCTLGQIFHEEEVFFPMVRVGITSQKELCLEAFKAELVTGVMESLSLGRERPILDGYLIMSCWNRAGDSVCTSYFIFLSHDRSVENF